MNALPDDLIHQQLNQRFQVNQIWQKTAQRTWYKATDLHQSKEVWIESLLLTQATQTYLPQFYKQAEQWDKNSLKHPSIPGYLAHFEHVWQGQHFFCQAISSIPCQSLAERVGNGNLLSSDEALHYLTQACRILLFLHHLQTPLWHLALEPSCFLITPQKELLLTGFGLNRVEKATLYYPLSFESDYIALEQMRGERHAASDLYSLGATFVTALTGKPLSQWPERQFEKHPGISEDLAKLLRHLTEKDLSQRLTSLDELRNRLKQLQQPPVAASSQGNTFLKGLPWLVIPILLLGLWFGYQQWQAPDRSELPTQAPSTAVTNKPNAPPTNPSPLIEIGSEKGHLRLLGEASPKTPIVVKLPQLENWRKGWLTLVPADAPEQDWEQQVFLEFNGETIEFPAVPQEGHYEVRLFENWSPGATKIADRLPLKIGSTVNATSSTQKLLINPHQDFKRIDDDMPGGISTGQSRPDTLDKPLETLTGLPPDSETGEKTHGCFWLGNMADRCYAFMIHKDLLYVDKNNNEDLSDDGPSFSILRASIPFAVERVMTDGTTIQEPYHLWFFYNAYMNSYGMYARTYYEGEMNVGGLLYKMVLFETENHNGLFRDNGIWIDINRNDQFENQEQIRHHQTISLSNQTYEIILNTP